jgi:hypothetical protein
MLDHIANIKPKLTIFEIKAKKCKVASKDLKIINAANKMRTMREENAERLTKFKERKAMKITTMMEVIEKVKKESYIPYVKEGEAADKHLEINTFQSEAAAAILAEAEGKKYANKNKGTKVR